MSARDDGGPAFPIDPEYGEQGEQVRRDDGMSLRDYFAATALQGWLASFAGMQDAPMGSELAAQRAYGYADAMLTERAK